MTTQTREETARAFAEALGPCEEWQGHRNHHGYGVVQRCGKNLRAHRIAWERANGPILPGLVVCHRCDNPPCVRLSHLFVGTQAENMRDMRRKGRAAPSHPPIRRGVTNLRARLTDDAVRDIRRSRAIGVPLGELAARYGVKKPIVCEVAKGKKWRHVV